MNTGTITPERTCGRRLQTLKASSRSEWNTHQISSQIKNTTEIWQLNDWQISGQILPAVKHAWRFSAPPTDQIRYRGRDLRPPRAVVKSWHFSSSLKNNYCLFFIFPTKTTNKCLILGFKKNINIFLRSDFSKSFFPDDRWIVQRLLICRERAHQHARATAARSRSQNIHRSLHPFPNVECLITNRLNDLTARINKRTTWTTL